MPESVEVGETAQSGPMRTADVASFLGVSRRCLEQLEALGRLPPNTLGQRATDGDRTEIEARASEQW